MALAPAEFRAWHDLGWRFRLEAVVFGTRVRPSEFVCREGIVLVATWARRALQVWLPVVLDDAPGGDPDAGRDLFRSFWALQFCG